MTVANAHSLYTQDKHTIKLLHLHVEVVKATRLNALD